MRRNESFLLFLFILFLIVNISNTLLTTDWWGGNTDYLTQTVVVVTSRGYGTGWWVNHDHIITAYHVVEGAPDIKVVRGEWWGPAVVVHHDIAKDIAVLKVSNPPPWAKGLPLSSDLRLGDRVLVVGYPVQLYFECQGNATLMSISPRVASGTISWISPDPSHPVAEIDVSTDAGNSGGPVVKAGVSGVVGIIVYARKGVVSEGYYILRSDAIAEELREAGIGFKVRYDLRPILAGIGLVALVIGIIAIVLGGKRVAIN